MNYKETAKGILEHVGGVENISNMSHCATRLRLNLKDETLTVKGYISNNTLKMYSFHIDNLGKFVEKYNF